MEGVQKLLQPRKTLSISMAACIVISLELPKVSANTSSEQTPTEEYVLHQPNLVNLHVVYFLARLFHHLRALNSRKNIFSLFD